MKTNVHWAKYMLKERLNMLDCPLYCECPTVSIYKLLAAWLVCAGSNMASVVSVNQQPQKNLCRNKINSVLNYYVTHKRVAGLYVVDLIWAVWFLEI